MRKSIKFVSISLLVAMLIVSFAIVFATFTVKGEETDKKTDVFTMENGSCQENIAFPDKYYNATNVGKSNSGVAFYQNKGTLSFRYNHPVNFKTMTKDNPFIEFYAIMEENSAVLENISITLTDADDPSNTVQYFAFYQYRDGGFVYTRIRYAGKDTAEGGRNGNPWVGEYGKGATGWGFYYLVKPGNRGDWKPWSSDWKVIPGSFALDYATRDTYLRRKVGTIFEDVRIMDLDDPNLIGEGMEWQGFKSDKAYISVSANFSKFDKEGGIILKSIAGYNLDGAFTDALSYPKPKIDAEIDSKYIEEVYSEDELKETLPSGAVGIKYPVPAIRSFDYYFGEENQISYKIINTDTDADYTSDVVDGNFIPSVVGNYKIEYKADNGKNIGYKSYYFNITDRDIPVLIGLEKDFDTPKIGSVLYIPETNAFGGQGYIEKTERLFYNGVELNIPGNRTITTDKVGIITLNVECKCYGGENYVRNYSVNVNNSTILEVHQKPMIIKTGEELVLPEAVAYNSETKAPADVKITFDGKEISDRVVSTSKTSGVINVSYIATTDLGTATEEFSLKVIDPDTAMPDDYIVSDDSLVYSNTKYGIEAETVKDATFTWGYPVVTGYTNDKMAIGLYGVQGKSDFGYIDVILSDDINNNSETFIRVYKSSDPKETKIFTEGKNYIVGGSLYDGVESNRVMFYIKENKLCNYANDIELCSLSIKDAKTCKISFRFGDVNGKAGIAVCNIGNQNLDLVKDDGSWKDRVEPALLFDKKFDSVSKVVCGNDIVIPSCKAYDVFNSDSTVSIRVISPDNEVVFTSEDTTREHRVTLSKAGSYVVNFTVKDGNKGKGIKSCICDSIDVINPELTISGKISETMDVGANFTIPKATATDNTDAECQVLVYIRYMKDYSVKFVEMGSEFSFDKAGEYELIFVTHDNSFNYTRYVMPVKVGEVIYK